MTLAGVEVRDSAAANLACLLQKSGEEALAFHIGHAIDHQQDRVALTPRDRGAILRALTICPPELADLRAGLLADRIGQREALI